MPFPAITQSLGDLNCMNAKRNPSNNTKFPLNLCTFFFTAKWLNKGTMGWQDLFLSPSFRKNCSHQYILTQLSFRVLQHPKIYSLGYNITTTVIISSQCLCESASSATCCPYNGGWPICHRACATANKTGIYTQLFISQATKTKKPVNPQAEIIRCYFLSKMRPKKFRLL